MSIPTLNIEVDCGGCGNTLSLSGVLCAGCSNREAELDRLRMENHRLAGLVKAADELHRRDALTHTGCGMDCGGRLSRSEGTRRPTRAPITARTRDGSWRTSSTRCSGR